VFSSTLRLNVAKLAKDKDKDTNFTEEQKQELQKMYAEEFNALLAGNNVVAEKQFSDKRSYRAVARQLVGRSILPDDGSAVKASVLLDTNTGKSKEGLLCSEVASLLMIETINRVNQRIEEGKTKEGESLDLPKGLELKLPFARNTEFVTPKMLEEYLKKNDLAEEVGLPIEVTKFVNTEKVREQHRFHVESKDWNKIKIGAKALKEELLKYQGVTNSKDPVSKMIELVGRLEKEQNAPVLYKIINTFKKIFGMRTTSAQLQKLVQDTCKKFTTCKSLEAAKKTKESFTTALRKERLSIQVNDNKPGL